MGGDTGESIVGCMADVSTALVPVGGWGGKVLVVWSGVGVKWQASCWGSETTPACGLVCWSWSAVSHLVVGTVVGPVVGLVAGLGVVGVGSGVG